MNVDLFGNSTDTVEVDFNNGMKVTMRKFVTAGVQEDLEAEATKIHQRNRNDDTLENDLSPDLDDEDDTTVVSVHVSKLKMLQKMLVRIEGPGLRKPLTAPFGMQTVRGFSREAFIILTDIIEENNPPVNQVREMLKEAAPEPMLPQASPTFSPVSETPVTYE